MRSRRTVQHGFRLHDLFFSDCLFLMIGVGLFSSLSHAGDNSQSHQREMAFSFHYIKIDRNSVRLRR